MEENMKEKKFTWKTVAAVCLWIVVIYLVGEFGFDKYRKYMGMRTHNSILKSELQQTVQENKDYSLSLDVCRSNYDKLKDQYNDNISSISKADKDLQKLDIYNYIREHYTKVSKVVAFAIAETIINQSEKFHVPPELILGIIEVESEFTPRAKSKAGALGLMQVMPEWVPKLGIEKERDLYEIDINIESGIKVLKIHIKEQKGSLKKGLYYYVNKDKTYSNKVFAVAGKFTIFKQAKIKDSLSQKSNGIKVKVSKTK